MKISIVSIPKETHFADYSQYLPLISTERREKISAIKSESGKLISLLSQLLAQSEISKRLSVPFEEIEFFHNAHGKPYIQKEDFHFSLSHSDNLIAFVSHSTPVGIDIQKMSDYISPAIRFFTENEKMYIGENPERFFEIWTKKEAYLKMLGTGLSTPLSSFDVLAPPVCDMLFSTKAEDCSLSVCTHSASDLQIKIEFIK